MNTIFLNNKYTLVYYQIIDRAKTRNTKKMRNDGHQTHHIIPKCLSGTDDPSNLVVLTYKEHRVCHRLLISMTTGIFRYKLMYAYKLFNKHFDLSNVPNIREYKKESYMKMADTRKSNGSYKTGKENNFSKPEIIEIVKKRMVENNPMKDKKQRDRMKLKNNNPFSRSVKIEGQLFPTLFAAACHFNTTPYLLKKNFNLQFEDKSIPTSRHVKYKDRYITPFGMFKTKKEMIRSLGIPEWTLNTIYDNLDSLPVSNGRASKKISHLLIDYTKTWRENGFDLIDN
jgi:hypothetical protein